MFDLIFLKNVYFVEYTLKNILDEAEDYVRKCRSVFNRRMVEDMEATYILRIRDSNLIELKAYVIRKIMYFSV